MKQRLLGAVILAALLVILVPELLDGAGHKSRFPSHIEIPDEPVFTPMTEIMPDKPQTRIEREKSGTKTSIHAWALQVGSFGEENNAQVLRDKLRAKGYATYVDVLKTPTKSTYRVRIGPELDRGRLDKLKDKVFKEEKIEAMIVTHP